jgi:hypothetical protein
MAGTAEFPADGYRPAGDGPQFVDGYRPRHANIDEVARNEDLPIFRSAAGVDWYMKDTPEGIVIQGAQDVYSLLEANKAMFSENDGWSKGEKFMRRAASIPMHLRMKWLIEEGWDAWRPDLYWDQLKRKLNDIDYRRLRTADWRV